MRLPLLSVIAACACTVAAAQTVPMPDTTVPDKDRKEFRVCRAAIIIESGAPEGERTALPPAVTAAMREQITFIMSETVLNVPALSMKDGAKRMNFAEQFLVDFSRTIGAEVKRLADPAVRGPVLLNCQPLLWSVMKLRIDVLIGWRKRAMGLDTPFPTDKSPVLGSTPPK